MTAALPDGIEAAWQDAIAEENHGQWDELASDLLRHAKDCRDPAARDDLLTLTLVACERADQIVERVWVLRGDAPMEEPA